MTTTRPLDLSHHQRRRQLEFLAHASRYGGYFFLTSQKGWYLGQTAADAYSGVNVYHTTNGGSTWNQISGTQWGGTMDYVDDNNGWIIAISGSGQAFVRTTNGGLSYALLTPHLAP